MTEALRLTLDEQMFGFRVIKPLDWDWFKAAPARLQYQVSAVLWRTEVTYMWQSFTQYAWRYPISLDAVIGVLEACGAITSLT